MNDFSNILIAVFISTPNLIKCCNKDLKISRDIGNYFLLKDRETTKYINQESMPHVFFGII